MSKVRSKVKVSKKSNDQMKDVQNMIYGLTGHPDSINEFIVDDKLKDYKENFDRLYDLFHKFYNKIFIKVLNAKSDIIDIKKHKNEIEDFKKNIDFNLNKKIEFNRKEIIEKYTIFKNSEMFKDCIIAYKKLLQYEKYININDIKNISNKFITNETGYEIIIFPFFTVNFKQLHDFCSLDENSKTYILIFLQMSFKFLSNIYEIAMKPDIDPENSIDTIIDMIKLAKREIRGCDAAFNKIINSVSILKDNFNIYYKDFMKTQNPGSIIEDFIKDVYNTIDLNTKIKGQFASIVNHFKNKSKGKINDPKLNNLFNTFDFYMDSLEKEENNNNSNDESDNVIDILKSI